jgi:hypothetical protein
MMGNRLSAGREFTWTDTYERRPVAMVSENLARELWQDPQRAIGKEIREDFKGPWREVIGHRQTPLLLSSMANAISK